MPALQHMSQRQETIPSGGDSITALILLLLPLLIISVALIFVLIAPFIIYLVLRFRPGGALSERDGPINVQYEEQLEFSSSFQRACQNWADQLDDNTRAGYEQLNDGAQIILPFRPAIQILLCPSSLGFKKRVSVLGALILHMNRTRVSWFLLAQNFNFLLTAQAWQLKKVAHVPSRAICPCPNPMTFIIGNPKFLANRKLRPLPSV